MRKIKRHFTYFPFLFLVIFLGAFLLRVLLIHWTLQFWNNGDLTRYEDWVRVAHTYTFAQTYTGTHSTKGINNQPPGTLYVLSATYETYILEGKIIAKITHAPMGSILWVNTFLQHTMMKLLPLMTDFLTAFLIYHLVTKEAGKKRGLFAASLFLFNPIIFYNSAIWGQIDSVNNFFLMLSLFFAFRKNVIFSLIAYAVSLYIKLSLLPLLPFYLIFLFFISGRNRIRISVGIPISIGAIILATLPISHSPVQWLFTELPLFARGELQNITIVAFNFWYMVTCFPWKCTYPVVTQKFLGLPLTIWAYGLFGLFSLPLLYGQIKRHKEFISMRNIFLILSIGALFAFLFLPKMHDRYMYPFFPLFAVFLGLSKKSKTYIIIFCLLTLFHLENLVYSWYPTPLKFVVPFYAIFYDLTFRWTISILTVIVAVWLYGKSFIPYFLSKET